MTEVDNTHHDFVSYLVLKDTKDQTRLCWIDVRELGNYRLSEDPNGLKQEFPLQAININTEFGYAD